MPPKRFLFPYLAHALGRFVAALVADGRKMTFALVLDLGVAYYPMSLLGGRLGAGKKSPQT